jgi:hypothetical protein
VKDLKKEEEREIEILFSKEGFFRITLDSIQIHYPPLGVLKLVQTSFLSSNEITTRSSIEEIPNGIPRKIDREIKGFAGIICSYQVPKTSNFFLLTTDEIKIKLTYRVLGFQMFKEKIVKINP